MTSKIKVDNINKVSDDSNIINRCGTTITVGCGGTVTNVPGAATITGDLKSDSLKAADGGVIISQSGTTITIGASGDTVSLASGASQSGFGRAGSVDWQTGSIKTATFTAANGEGYFADTSSSGFVMNLPAGTAGAIVAVVDYTNTFNSNALTVTPNGSQKIGGAAASASLSTLGQSVTFVYIDDTEGWKAVNNTTTTVTGQPAYVTATGGTVITCGNFKTHIFTGPGTFCVSDAGNPLGSSTVDYFVVAGGGASHGDAGGGSGGGGFRLSNTVGCVPAPTMSPKTNTSAGIPISSAGPMSVTVGAGGSAPVDRGSSSTFGPITSTGGGAPTDGPNPCAPLKPGGSGGGARSNGPSLGGTGNTPPVTPPQGERGGNNPYPAYSGGAGGGGAGGQGTDKSGAPTGTPGGPGSYIAQSWGIPTSYGTSGPVSSTRYFAGGGGAAYEGVPGPGGSGGTGGGGPGAPGGGSPGSTNTGGGGGGSTGNSGKNGGSGFVAIRYKYQN